MNLIPFAILLAAIGAGFAVPPNTFAIIPEPPRCHRGQR